MVLHRANPRVLFTKRAAMIGFAVLLVATISFVALQRAAARQKYTKISPKASRKVDRDRPLESVLNLNGKSILHRFLNGNVSVATDKQPDLLEDHKLYGMSLESLEYRFEQMLTLSTADCSAYSGFGRRQVVGPRGAAAGHSVCTVGPFQPSQPCYGFSFGNNRSLRFEEDMSASTGCYVIAFDPTMRQSSHLLSERVLLLRAGLGAAPNEGQIKTDSYLGYLKQFKAEKTVIDVLKVDVCPGDWSSIETAASDGSLRLTKQLLMTIRIENGASLTVKELVGSNLALLGLHNAGFRQWRLLYTTVGVSISYININFVLSNTVSRQHQLRNKVGSIIDLTLENLPISRSPGSDQLNTVFRTNLSALSPSQLDHLYFQLVEQQHLFCPHSRRIGDVDDGGWDVCFSEPFSIDSVSHCTAFSFGINSVWKYDDELADKFHCRVFMFDPSMKKVSDHRRRKTSWFYRTGLSSSNKTSPEGWKMRTLCELFQEHAPGNATIDILKIDVEYSEWAALEQALKDGCLTRVKQIFFETHTDGLFKKKSNYSRFIRIFLGVLNLGFRTWKWHRNPYSQLHKSVSGLVRPCCYEHYLLNTKFLVHTA